MTKRSDGGDSIIEFDSSDKPNNATPRTDVRMSNITGVSARGRNTILIRGGGDLVLANSIFVNPTGTCLDIDDAATVQAAGAAADENGPPVFRSVVFACQSPYVEDTNVTSAQVQAIFTGGTNNNPTFASTLTDVIINDANETAVTPFNATSLAPFFLMANDIGAVRDGNDNWYAGWACGVNSKSSNCTAIPARPTT